MERISPDPLSAGLSTAPPDIANATDSPKRKRASRKGQPKRFSCNYEGCERTYSRAEHLARHQLNHNPKEIYRCEVEGCGHTFVRPDLFARHKARHEEPQGNSTKSEVPSSSPDKSIASSAPGGSDLDRSIPVDDGFAQPANKKPKLSHADSAVQRPSTATTPAWQHQMPQQPQSLPTPGPTIVQTRPSPMDRQLPPLSSLPAYNSSWLGQASIGGFNNDDLNTDQTNDNFATWLFDSPNSHNSGFDFNNMPFLDFGMDYSMSDMWSMEDTGMQGLLGSRTYSSNSVASERPLEVEEDPHIRISENRRTMVLSLFSSFMTKKRPKTDRTNQPESILYDAESGQWPNMSASVLESCIASFWRDVASQMPIVHEPTFSASRCQPLLLLAILALGAGALVRTQPRGVLQDYRILADFVATNLRWEIFTHDDAQPPVHLWVAQSLLLLEHYEKMYSTRQLHERAHIHHASTLTLLRRGNPMVGRTGSETPPSGPPTRQPSPVPGTSHIDSNVNPETRSWWKRWVSNESMNRVVFAAFQMDTLHASMFGHSADLLPHELRLQLPCDDSLWNATSAEEVRRLEGTFAMYRIKTVNFLDGLKRCLHGYEVQTHHYARMVLMSGLLSVGWHINRREKHVQFVETVPLVQEQARWRSLLLQAFGHWRRSFDEVLDHNAYRGPNNTRPSSKDMSDPTVLFHLAHLTMHIDIIDVQILSGSKRLLGRKVSDRDRASVTQRMRVWASTSMARHAALHAFKLLESTFCAKRFRQTVPSPQNGWSSVTESTYTCRSDTFVYRPWILCLAGLTIWAYQYACPHPPSHYQNTHHNSRTLTSACQYIATCAATDNEDRLPLLISKDGCAAVLQILMDDFASAESEIMHEASKRMQDCLKKLDAVELPMVNR